MEARTTRATEPEHDAEPWRVLAQARVGQMVGGRLRLERVLGIGGTASVYAARHRNGRALAVKVLHSAFSHHPNIRQRFLAEGYAANKVDHPDAVAILDEGEDSEGNIFIVMELLRGESLLERLRAHGPLPRGEVISIALRVLDVLARAHDRGVVHRDIKPGNLFQTETGAIKVLDFGIARVEGGPGAFSTRPGTTLGTPAFMAPELAAGRLEQLDALTDLWALGATMFQLLTGETVHPFDADLQLIVLAATRPARSLASLRPDLEPWLVKVVDRTLAFDRQARWPNARAMSAALSEPAMREGLISVQPNAASDANDTAPEMSLPPSRPAPRQRLHGALGWALALLLALGAVSSVLAIQYRVPLARTKTSAVAPPEQAPTQVVSGVTPPSESRNIEPAIASAVPSPSAGAPSASGSTPLLRAPRSLPAIRPLKAHSLAPAKSSPPQAPAASANNPLFFPNQ
ncbi:MAG TPA: protein kinase [Polyangiaceae bacterium]|nr:protein kinase [Polyangiaceae bacterium]